MAPIIKDIYAQNKSCIPVGRENGKGQNGGKVRGTRDDGQNKLQGNTVHRDPASVTVTASPTQPTNTLSQGAAHPELITL